jgi:cellulose synthase/poly-beta-1,6-N-acetylglucosamine synthase-like glycosyltransferase
MGMTLPLVSVITPAWQRYERLLNRCIASVQAQTYQRVEHIVVGDGPDPGLADLMGQLMSSSAIYHPVRFFQLAEHDPERHWGHYARLRGIEESAGEYIAYVDDDDALRPEHVRLLAEALTRNPDAAWAYSVMASHSQHGTVEIGYQGYPAEGQIGTPMIMHRREILEHGTWGPASSVEDWNLVKRWLDAGQQYVHVPEVTVDVWPSVYHEHF